MWIVFADCLVGKILENETGSFKLTFSSLSLEGANLNSSDDCKMGLQRQIPENQKRKKYFIIGQNLESCELKCA